MWEQLKAICDASNKGDDTLVARLILETNFEQDGAGNLLAAAVCAFEITDENIAAHRDAAERLAKIDESLVHDFRTSIRLSLISNKLVELYGA